MKILNGNTVRAGVVSLSALLLTCCGPLRPTYAEGHVYFGRDAWGVNRVILTNGNYYSVEGNANIWFRMPAEQDGGVIATTPMTNPYDNKPSAYLGARELLADGLTTRMEADAGLQYETNDWRDYLKLYGVNEGWAAFSSANAAWTSPQVWETSGGTVDTHPTRPDGTDNPDYNPTGGKWVAWRGGVQNAGEGRIQSDMRFDIMPDGAVRIRIGVFNRLTNTQNPNEKNAFFWNDTIKQPTPINYSVGHYQIWPWEGVPRFGTASDARARTSVKRVSAMTRANNADFGAIPAHDELDGSEMNVTFTACRVARVGGVLSDWTDADVDQVHTGYDAQPDLLNGTINHRAYDRRSLWTLRLWTPLGDFMLPSTSRTIVTFGIGDTLGNANARAYNTNARANSTNGYYPARYRDETVRILLGTATRLVGSPLEYSHRP